MAEALIPHIVDKSYFKKIYCKNREQKKALVALGVSRNFIEIDSYLYFGVDWTQKEKAA